MLTVAYELLKFTEATLKAIQGVSRDFVALDELSESCPPPKASPRAIYDDMLRDKYKLENRHADSISEAREDFARASRRVYELEAELDAARSMLAFTQRSALFLLDLKGRIQDELRPKKDLVGARRRVPAELWAQIFLESVRRDEKEFEVVGREGSPPFTSLRLSWVCKFWRAIAQTQPALWQYIAIPRAVEVSQYQWERVRFYLSLAKAYPPSVYVVPECRGEPGSGLRTHQLLQQFERFRKLELRVSRRTSEAEDLLATLEPNVDELVLVGTFKAGTPGTNCPLNYGALVNVKGITCVHLQPFMRNPSPNVEVRHLTTAKFIQNALDSRSVLQFLEALPTVEDVEIELLADFSCDADIARASIVLPGIKRISGGIDVLCGLFTQAEALPNLEHVTLKSETGNGKEDSGIQWSHFLGIHSRATSIQSLTLGTIVVPATTTNIAEAYARIVQQLPHLHSLHLMEDAIVHALEGMRITQNIPTELRILLLSGDTVKEDHIATFLRYFHTTRRADLELGFVDCPTLSDDSRERLAKLNMV